MTTTPSTTLSASLSHLNPQQQQAVIHPLDHGLHVIAGAGTGKTTVISHRYAHCYQTLLKEGLIQPEKHILTLTFTIKAAEEMALRIRKQLDAISQSNTSQAFDPQQAYVLHFHGLGQRLLRQHGQRIGLPTKFSILDSAEQEHHTRQLIEKLAHPESHPSLQQTIRHAIHANHLEDLVSPDALSHTWIHQHITDLPTHEILQALPTIIDRIKSAGLSPKQLHQLASTQHQHFIQMLNRLPLQQVDGTPFETNQDMAQAWDDHTASWQHQPNTLRGKDLGADEKMLKSQLEWLNAKWKVMVHGVPTHPLPRYSYKKIQPGDERAWQRVVDHLEHHRPLIDTVTAFYALYQYHLHQNSLCDFNDLILRSLELFETCPDLLQHYQQQFRHIIVDEFQDTNDSQLKLIQILLGNHQSHVTVVGDEKQSIYGFRFAQPENLHRLAQHCPSMTPLNLDTNYRCHPVILDVANAVTNATLQKPDQQLKAGASPSNKTENSHATVEWIDLSPAEEEPEQEREKENTPSSSSKNQKPQKTSILLYQQAEARWIAQRIQALCHPHRENTPNQYTYNDIAILVPTHTKAARIAEELTQANIPSSLEKGFALFTHPETLDLQAWMQWLQNPNHSEALLRLLQNKLTDKQLHTLCKLRGYRSKNDPSNKNNPPQQPISLLQALQSPEGQTSIRQWPTGLQHALNDLLQTHQQTRQQLRQVPLLQAIQHSAEHLGLLSENQLAAPRFIQWIEGHLKREKSYLTLGQLNQRIHVWQRLNNPVLEQAPIQNSTAHKTNDSNSSNQGGQGLGVVRILTIHASKGLEFPVVFVSGVHKTPYRSPLSDPIGFEPQFAPYKGFGLFLNKTPIIDGEQHSTHSLPKRFADNLWCRPRFTDEQQRLFYVAITRAKEHLFVIRHPEAPEWTALEPLTPHLNTPINTIGTIGQKETNGTAQTNDHIQHTRLPINHIPVPESLASHEQSSPHNHPSKTSSETIQNSQNREQKSTHPQTPKPSPPQWTTEQLGQVQQCPVSFQLRLQGVRARVQPQHVSQDDKPDTKPLETDLTNLLKPETLQEQAHQLAQQPSLTQRPAHIHCNTVQCGYHVCCPQYSES